MPAVKYFVNFFLHYTEPGPLIISYFIPNDLFFLYLIFGPLYYVKYDSQTLAPTSKLIQCSKWKKAKAKWIVTTGVEACHTEETQMFRCKLFEPTLTGFSYSIFVECLKSAVTKSAYIFAL